MVSYEFPQSLRVLACAGRKQVCAFFRLSLWLVEKGALLNKKISRKLSQINVKHEKTDAETGAQISDVNVTVENILVSLNYFFLFWMVSQFVNLANHVNVATFLRIIYPQLS